MKAKKILILSSFMLLAAGSLISCDSVFSTDTSSEEDTLVETEDYVDIDSSDFFSDKDYETDYSDEDLVEVALSDGASSTSLVDGVSIDGNVITISAEGYYEISGTLSEGQIVINNETDEKIHLILNNANVTNSTGPALLVENADKVFITTADGSINTMNGTVGEDDDYNAAVYSSDDLTLNGLGVLNVVSNYHGIKSTDELTITSGTYKVEADGNCLRGKDSVAIADGTFELIAGTDGIHAEDSDDATNGNVYIIGGDITIDADDDGIHAENTLTIYDGTINIINSYEGIEGMNIYVGGGNIDITAIDDGINTSDGTGGGDTPVVNEDLESSISFVMAGGYIHVDATADGIDSNGYIWITGGEIVIDGPTDYRESAIDFDASCYINGGTVIGFDASENLELVSDYSEQGSIMYTLDSSEKSGTLVTLSDASGEELLSYSPTKTFSTVVFSSAEVVEGETYTLNVGSDEYTIKMDSMAYSNYTGTSGDDRPGAFWSK
jgi:hypothetical protein